MAGPASYSPDGTRLAYVPHEQWQAAVEALPRRPDDADLDRRPRRLERRRRSRATTRTTSTRCGSATRSTSCPTATARSPCSPTTRQTKQVSEALAERRLRLQVRVGRPGRHRLRAVRRAQLYRPRESGRRRRCPSASRQTAERPAAFRESRPEALPERRHLADRRARGVRGPRRDPHGARREGRRPQPDPYAGVAERDPAWSPDGKSIAYFSDESGEYALHFATRTAGARLRRSRWQPPSFFYSPTWSPDSKKIAFIDKRLNLWYVDLDSGKPVEIDTDYFGRPDPARSIRSGRPTASGSPTRSSSRTTCTPSSCTRWRREVVTRSPTA